MNISIIPRWSFAAILALCVTSAAHGFSVTHWTFSENHPAVKEGGRTNTVAINQANRTRMFAASETGGLFKSINGGDTWTHVDSLKVMFTQSVVYVDGNVNPDIVLVTAKADFKTKNGGGVWRSTDGGNIWNQADLTAHLPNFTGRLSAYGIVARGNTVVAGTSEGVFISHDAGQSWTYENVFGDINPPTPESKKVLSVMFGTGPRIFAGGPAGVRLRAATTWVEPFVGAGPIDSIHAFESGRFTGHAFVVNASRQLFLTENNGTTWRQFEAPPPPGSNGCSGIAFIKVKIPTITSPTEDLYFGNRCSLWRSQGVVDSNGVAHHTGNWVQLSVDASGPRDMAKALHIPALLASNGGLHDTADDGTTWKLAGGGRDGYTSLQINEVKGQIVAGTTDLYIGTQQNKLWSLTIWGVPHEFPADPSRNPKAGVGFYIEADHKVPSARDSKITFAACNPCKNKETGRQFEGGLEEFRNPPGFDSTPALLKPSHYVQGLRDTNNLDAGLVWTGDSGHTWWQFATFTEERRDLPRAGRPDAVGATIVYQPYRTNALGAAWDESQRLIRAHKNLSSSVPGTPFFPAMELITPDGPRQSALGVNPTMFPWYQVYGVDPGNAYHIIAPDVINEEMMVTTDGGDEWRVIPGLKDLVTQDPVTHASDHFRFVTPLIEGHDPIFPFVTAVSFCPHNPNLVLIGTSEGGVFISNDNGGNWKRIERSEAITYITSFWWEDANHVFVSTYGRGLWRLTGVQVEIPGAFDVLCGSACEVISNDGGPRPQFDRSLLVFGGSLLAMRTEKGQLREALVTTGSSVVFTGDQDDPQQDIVITESDGSDASRYEPLPRPPADGWIAKGMVFTKGAELLGTVFGDSEATLVPPVPKETYKGSTESPTKGTPYVRVITDDLKGVVPNGSFRIAATDFLAGASYEVLIDGAATKGTITADGNGSFTTTLTAPAEPGSHRVEVRLAGDESIIDGSTVLVMPEN